MGPRYDWDVVMLVLSAITMFGMGWASHALVHAAVQLCREVVRALRPPVCATCTSETATNVR